MGSPGGHVLVESMKLRYPVHTPDNRVLLTAGSELSAALMQEIAFSGAGAPQRKYPLLQYGTTRDDLAGFLSQPPYRAIFHHPDVVSDVLGLMERVQLVFPFLETLDYFRVRDFYTYRHMLTVFALSTALARDLLPDYEERIQEMATGPTHDFGKVCVPLGILKKETPLTRSERSILSHHSVAGYVLLCYYHGDPTDLAGRVARDHHERRDGSGYPRGILIDDYLVEIISVCDIFDALVSPRPYRPASYDNRTALEEITSMAERKVISWDVVKALVARHRRKKGDFRSTVVSVQKRGMPPANNYYGVTAEDEGPAPSAP